MGPSTANIGPSPPRPGRALSSLWAGNLPQSGRKWLLGGHRASPLLDPDWAPGSNCCDVFAGRFPDLLAPYSLAPSGDGLGGIGLAVLSFLWAQGPFSKQNLGHVGWNRILSLSTQLFL